MKHISNTLIEVLSDSFNKTLERRHNKPSKAIKWTEMTKDEQTIQMELVAMKTRANKRGGV
jgi:hypothetical protein